MRHQFSQFASHIRTGGRMDEFNKSLSATQTHRAPHRERRKEDENILNSRPKIAIILSGWLTGYCVRNKYGLNPINDERYLLVYEVKVNRKEVTIISNGSGGVESPNTLLILHSLRIHVNLRRTHSNRRQWQQRQPNTIETETVTLTNN